MNYYHTIIETIGNTPLIKINRLAKHIRGKVLVKIEYFNPGNSMKDRIAIQMIADAEKKGILRSGGTIIEATSGNTGMGLALVAACKGYRCIFTISDKQSQEKIAILKALGSKVIICPTNVSPEDPRSYYSVAKKLHQEIPNSFYSDQYHNLSNTMAHYKTTGPEIWKQTDGKITHYVAGVGTGGSICGAAKYLKEKNKKILAIGIDSYGSVFKKYKETGIFDKKEIYPYLTEGIGEDILPGNVDFSLIDIFIKVTDKDGAIMTRKLAREEGLFVGWSCGSAVYAGLKYAASHLKETDIMVIILPDHGTRYLHKIYNDNWMKYHGFREERDFESAKDIIYNKMPNYKLLTIDSQESVSKAGQLMNSTGISQLPVVENEDFVGVITDSNLLKFLIKTPNIKYQRIKEIMEEPLVFVSPDSTLDFLNSLISKNKRGVLVRYREKIFIITQHDILEILSK